MLHKNTMSIFVQILFIFGPNLVFSNLISSDSSGTFLVLSSSFQSAYSSYDPTNYFIDGSIYVSSNAGLTWTQTNAPVDSWLSIASNSETGSYITATSQSQTITSSDYGQTWSSNNGGLAVATDATGQYVALVTSTSSNSLNVRLSSDFGSTYPLVSTVASSYYYPTAISFGVNASTIVLATTSDGIYKTSNFGVSWVRTTGAPTSALYTALTRDFTGRILFATTSTSGIYKSTNGGSNWVYLTTSESYPQYTSITCSSDGTFVTAVSANGAVATSTTSGSTWSTITESSLNYWIGVAAESTGRVVNGLTAPDTSYISQAVWTSTTYGASFVTTACYPGFGLIDGQCERLGECTEDHDNTLKFNPILSSASQNCDDSAIKISDGTQCAVFCEWPWFSPHYESECYIWNPYNRYSNDLWLNCQGTALQTNKPILAIIVVFSLLSYLIPIIYSCKKIFCAYDFWKSLKLCGILFLTSVLPFLTALVNLLCILIVPWFHKAYFGSYILFYAFFPLFFLLRQMWNLNAQPRFYFCPVPQCIKILFENYDSCSKYLSYGVCVFPFFLLNLPALLLMFVVLFIFRLTRVTYFGCIHNILLYFWTADTKHHVESTIILSELNDVVMFESVLCSIALLVIQILNIRDMTWPNNQAPLLAVSSLFLNMLMIAYGLGNIFYYKLCKCTKVSLIPSILDCLDRDRDEKPLVLDDEGNVVTEKEKGGHEMVVMNSLHGSGEKQITTFMEKSRLENEFLLNEYRTLKQDYSVLRNEVDTLLGKTSIATAASSATSHKSHLKYTTTHTVQSQPTPSGIVREDMYFVGGDMVRESDIEANATGARME